MKKVNSAFGSFEHIAGRDCLLLFSDRRNAKGRRLVVMVREMAILIEQTTIGAASVESLEVYAVHGTHVCRDT